MKINEEKRRVRLLPNKEYTNEDIISSLEIIATTRNCNECKIRNCKWGTCNCSQTTANVTLDLINRQKAEIERLKRENEILSTNADTAFQDGLNEAQDLYATQVENEIKTEAIKEFADKLKENVTDCHTVSDGEYVGYDWTDIANCIDNLVKEVVGDTE